MLELRLEVGWTPRLAVERLPGTFGSRRKFADAELKDENAESIVVLDGAATALKFFAISWRKILARAPGQNAGPIEGNGAFKIDQTDFIAAAKEMGRLAVSPNPAGAVDLNKNRLKLLEESLGLAPRNSARLSAVSR